MIKRIVLITVVVTPAPVAKKSQMMPLRTEYTLEDREYHSGIPTVTDSPVSRGSARVQAVLCLDRVNEAIQETW
jgi:hypothetical protein